MENASLVLASSEGELFALRGYARALGGADELYWIGYRYSGSVLVDVNGDNAFSSIVTMGGPAPGDGVCVSLSQNGSLIRVLCNRLLDGYVCQFTINGKQNVGHVR